MTDYLRKGFLAGLGLAALTKEKLEKVVEDLVSKGELSEQEGKDLANDLMSRSEDFMKDLTDRVEGMVSETLSKLTLPSRQELKDLEERIAWLEEKKNAGA